MYMDDRNRYKLSIQEAFPSLPLEMVEFKRREASQDVLIVNGVLRLRFPKTEPALARLRLEGSLLKHVQPFLPIPIPDPGFSRVDAPLGKAFLGCRILSGRPITQEELATMRGGARLDSLADKLAAFLWRLHHVPREVLPDATPVGETREQIGSLYEHLHARLFPAMRPVARALVQERFDRFLSNESNFTYTPRLRHGDFGSHRLLWEPRHQFLLGINGFHRAQLGDPAYDFAGVLHSFGEPFLQRVGRFYSGFDEELWERSRFYHATFAMRDALAVGSEQSAASNEPDSAP